MNRKPSNENNTEEIQISDKIVGVRWFVNGSITIAT